MLTLTVTLRICLSPQPVAWATTSPPRRRKRRRRRLEGVFRVQKTPGHMRKARWCAAASRASAACPPTPLTWDARVRKLQPAPLAPPAGGRLSHRFYLTRAALRPRQSDGAPLQRVSADAELGSPSGLGRQTGSDLWRPVRAGRGGWGAVGAVPGWDARPATPGRTDQHLRQPVGTEPPEQLQTLSPSLEQHLQPAGDAASVQRHHHHPQMYTPLCSRLSN